MSGSDDSEKELVRARTDIVALVSRYTPLKRAGSKYKGLCPFHQERTPSFHVDPELGRWRCFGACSEGGDVFKFLEKAEGLNFREALELLAERAGVTLTRGGGTPAEQEEAQRQRSERDRLYSINALALRFFRESFGRAPIAQEYARKRGLTHQTMENFGVGFAADDWTGLVDYLRSQKIHLEDAEKAGLVFASRRGDGTYTDKFRGRLMFPIVDTQERVVGFGGRLLLPVENAPKYLNSPETPVFSKSKILYALNRARKAIEKADAVLVVEGYMDAVACHQAGIDNVVATLGTSLTDEHVRLIRRYTHNVVLSFDADDAGVRAALRAAEIFRTATGGGIAAETGTLRILSLPPGEDPDSLLARGGAAAFRKATDAALSVPVFQLKALLARHNTTTDAGKLAYLRDALPIVVSVPSVLERDVLIRYLTAYHPAGGTHAEASIRAEIARLPLRGEIVIPPRRGNPGGYERYPESSQSSYGPPRRAPAGNPPAPTPRWTAERTLLGALLSDDWAKETARELHKTAQEVPCAVGALFPTLLAGQLAEVLAEQIEGHYSPRQAVVHLADPDLKDLASDVRMEEDESAPLSLEVIVDCVRALKLRQIRTANEETARAGREGNRPLTDEELRQWARRSRATKNDGGTPDENR